MTSPSDTDLYWFSPITYDEVAKCTRGKTEIEVAREDLDEAEQGKLVSIVLPRRLSSEKTYKYGITTTVMYDPDKIPEYKNANKVEKLSNDLLWNFLVFHKINDGVSWGEFGWHPDSVINDLKIDVHEDRYKEDTSKVHGEEDMRDFFRWAWYVYNGFSGLETKSAWKNAEVKEDEWNINGTVYEVEVKDVVTDVLTGRWYTNPPRPLDTYVVDNGDLEDAPNTEVFGSTDPITRPNGDLYYPRRLSSSTVNIKNQNRVVYHDVAALQSARDAGIFTLLYGPPGTGKTALAEAAFTNIITMEGTADTETSDFVGTYIQVEDRFEWVDGPLVKAMESGVPLLIDEVALIDTRMMAVVYSVMDGRAEVNVTANPSRGVVHAKEGFYIVGACNPDVPGAIMSDALLSRFSMQIEVTTDYSMLSKLGVDSKIIRVAQHLARQVQEGQVMKAPQTRELLAYQKIKDKFGEATALSNFISSADSADRKMYQDSINSTFGTVIAGLSI
ncbi:porphyrin biosynthesis [Gordonia phage Phendrix]|uniref:AAA-ATPase n=2 Tax=Godonkavirus TaxID=2733178 RepID=A0A4D6E288_9CAUD|nr:porphyrin biosynthesis [Gordonia phage GodonK]YP_010649147.1 porphyrin biosynthesis [Gordonia phage Phendrix]QBZ72726.1 AAA-ATPase [Gordonia phage GodonK]QDK02651.1 AAA-ATPase [Gordonia phage Phendrix]